MKWLRYKQTIVQARTKEQAIQKALEKLNTTADQAKVQVIQEPRKGIFGFFQRDAKVLVECKRTPNEKVRLFLHSLMEKMEIHPSPMIEFTSGSIVDSTYIQIKGEKLGVLIGKKGQTLDSLQYLVNLVANQDTKQLVRFVLDVNGYRKKREQLLLQLVKRVSRIVKKEKRAVKLEPMSSFERKVIHMLVDQDPDLTTKSEGIEPNRSVVVKLKNP